MGDEQRRRSRHGAQLVGSGVHCPQDERERERSRDSEREADCECPQRASCQATLALHERDAKPGEWAELRADHHRPDDQDQRVLNDPDSGDHRREDHEGEKADGELGAFRRLLLYRLPDDGVGG